MSVVLKLDFENLLKGKKIFITGHSGFTGSWASIWLNLLGAKVYGFSLPPDTDPNLFSEARIEDLVSGEFGDITDFEPLHSAMAVFQPDLVLHLAAQPLVRRSYREPRETFSANTLGTANVLEAARQVKSIRGVLCITTDKVYKNFEWDKPYVESDELGGRDPYSASKAAAEIVISSFRDSFPYSKGLGPAIAVARGGNIIGGGDWSEDRLVPDFIRASQSGTPLEIRYPNATRPWQHVLALIEGYFMILSGLLSETPEKFAVAMNLGPVNQPDASVGDVVNMLLETMPSSQVRLVSSPLHEAGKLALDSSLAIKTIGWSPRWGTEEVVRNTAQWYSKFYAGNLNGTALCLEQINSWTKG